MKSDYLNNSVRKKLQSIYKTIFVWSLITQKNKNKLRIKYKENFKIHLNITK